MSIGSWYPFAIGWIPRHARNDGMLGMNWMGHGDVRVQPGIRL